MWLDSRCNMDIVFWPEKIHENEGWADLAYEILYLGRLLVIIFYLFFFQLWMPKLSRFSFGDCKWGSLKNMLACTKILGLYQRTGENGVLHFVHLSVHYESQTRGRDFRVQLLQNDIWNTEEIYDETFVLLVGILGQMFNFSCGMYCVCKFFAKTRVFFNILMRNLNSNFFANSKWVLTAKLVLVLIVAKRNDTGIWFCFW